MPTPKQQAINYLKKLGWIFDNPKGQKEWHEKDFPNAIDIAIKQAKKEVFDDSLFKQMLNEDDYILRLGHRVKLEKKHLSEAFSKTQAPKKSQLNTYKKDVKDYDGA